MRLTELEPRWVNYPSTEPGRPLALQFICPTCANKEPSYRHTLCIPVSNPVDGGPMAAPSEYQQARWLRDGEDFETLSLTPSIHNQVGKDGQLVTHWHGFITKGEVVNA